MFQPLYWSTRTMLWIFASSTVRRIPIGCRTLWMSSHGRCHSSARKVSSSSTSQWRRYWGQGRGAITPSLDKKCVGKSFIHFLGSYGMPSHHGPGLHTVFLQICIRWEGGFLLLSQELPFPLFVSHRPLPSIFAFQASQTHMSDFMSICLRNKFCLLPTK